MSVVLSTQAIVEEMTHSADCQKVGWTKLIYHAGDSAALCQVVTELASKLIYITASPQLYSTP